MNFTSTHIEAVLPKQKVAFSKKTKKWRETNVEAISNMGNSRDFNGRTTFEAKQSNYNIVNSIIDEREFNYVMDPYGNKDNVNIGQPAKFRNINLISTKVNLLKGEELQRPFNFQAVAINGNAISEKEKQKKELLLSVAQAKLAQQLGIPQQNMIDPATGEDQPPQTFEGVEEYATYSMKDIREKQADTILQYELQRQNLRLKFNEGFEHALIAAEEIYYIGIVNNQPVVRICNPLNCEYDRNPDNPNIEDGDWFREERWMTPGQILDEYSEYLTSAQVTKLDEHEIRNSSRKEMLPGFGYTQSDIRNYDQTSTLSSSRTNSTHWNVTHVVWKSMKKIGFVTYKDENDEFQSGIVDETWELTSEMIAAGYKVEWKWIPDIWHGTRIGDDFYVQIEPMPNQSRSMDNPSEVKLPYVGRVYNGTNTVQTSLVSLLKPHQFLYNIIWFRLEAEIAKAKGKKMLMDIAQIPKSQGYDVDKWIEMFDNVGIAWINSLEEGKEGGQQGNVSGFNQFREIDMTMSQSVGQYINILTKIEQIVDKLAGINTQREGGIHQSETVGGIERAVSQSSNITEHWHYIHNEVVNKVLTQLIETAKFAYPETKKIHFIMDDVQRINMEIDMEKFSDSDYSIFLTDSSREHALKQRIEALAEHSISSGAASIVDAIEMYRDTSVSSLINKLKVAEIEKQQREAELQQQQAQLQQQALDAAALEKQEERAFEAEQNQLDRENDIRKATIAVLNFDEGAQKSDEVEVLEYSKQALSEVEAERKYELENRKINLDQSNKQKELSLKEKEIQSKEKIEKLKARTALKNKVPGEK